MEKFSKEQVEKAYNSLDLRIKPIATSPQVLNDIIEIAKKYNLRTDREGDFVELVGNSIIGLLDFSKLLYEIENIEEINRDIAQKIMTDLDNKIFSKIRKTLEQSLEEEIKNIEEIKTEGKKDFVNNSGITKKSKTEEFFFDPYRESIE